MSYLSFYLKAVLISIQLIIYIQPGHCESQSLLSLRELIEESKLIVLAQCEYVDSEMYSIEFDYFPGEHFSGIRSGGYGILEVLKGQCCKSYLKINYERTNQLYSPFIEDITPLPLDHRLSFNPVQDERVFLFVEQDSIIQFGVQGKIVVNKSTDKSFRKIIAEAIEKENAIRDKITERVFTNLNSDDWRTKCNARDDLRKIDIKKYSLRIAKLLDSDDDQLINAALNALFFTTDTLVVPYVLPILKHPKTYFREHAVSILSDIPSEFAFKKLMESYNDSSSSVRGKVISGLYNQYSAVQSLPYYERSGFTPMRGWGYDADPMHWESGDEILELYKRYSQYLLNYKNDVISFFYDAAMDTNAYMRRQGLKALRLVNSNRSTKILLEALNDSDALARKAAVSGLSERLEISAIEPLGQLVCTDTSFVLLSELMCLEKFAENGLIDVAEHSIIIECLRDILLNSENDLARGCALSILGVLNDPCVMNSLPEFLYGSFKGSKNRTINIMRKSNNPEYIPLLNEMLREETDPKMIDKLEYAIRHIRYSNK